MRNQLKKINEVRTRFQGTFSRYGSKHAFKGPDLKTVLLKDIKDLSGKQYTDHLWFNFTKGFEALGDLTEGDCLEFDARVLPYQKGYMGRRDDVWDKPVEIDYKLSHPTKITKRDKVK